LGTWKKNQEVGNARDGRGKKKKQERVIVYAHKDVTLFQEKGGVVGSPQLISYCFIS